MSNETFSKLVIAIVLVMMVYYLYYMRKDWIKERDEKWLRGMNITPPQIVDGRMIDDED